MSLGKKNTKKYTTRNSLVGTSSRYLILSTKYTSRLSESMPNLKEISELIANFNLKFLSLTNCLRYVENQKAMNQFENTRQVNFFNKFNKKSSLYRVSHQCHVKDLHIVTFFIKNFP